MKRHYKSGKALAFTMPLIIAAISAGAHAQETDEEVDELEEIVVTGIKASLSSAQSLKENADTFLDAITAQDIGALADRSVAEALQRVPGVNIGRFKKTSDPDRFSVEGVDVIIRGLPFVRSELNGRDVFSATGGRVLSFNDVSPELLGAVEVFKNSTADMIDGGIAGTVNLHTRKPLDSEGMRIAGSVEANYGDLADKLSPSFSVLASNTWEGSAGTFGLQLGYTNSNLKTRSDASQVTDPCYRAATFDSPCVRVNSVSSGGVGDQTGLTAADFPPSGSLVVPKGAGVRTTSYDRDREAFSAVAQWESESKDLLVTAEYLRAEADLFVDEHAMLALVNNDAFYPEPAAGSDWVFNDGVFESGVLTQVSDGGFPGVSTENLRFQRQDRAVTEDFSVDAEWQVNERLRASVEVQHVKSARSEDGLISAMHTWSDIFLDMGGETPDVQFFAPGTTSGGDQFTDPNRTFHWFLLDNQIDNEGDMTTFRGDIEYDLNEDGFFKRVKFGARWSDRNRVTRDANFANWGALSAPWASATFDNTPVYVSAVSNAASTRNPFESFQRGNASVPTPDGEALYFGSDEMLADYFSGALQDQVNEIHALTFVDDWGNGWQPIANRSDVVPGTPFRPGEISNVTEKTTAMYARVDFGNNNVPGDGIAITGNFGVRYVKTTIDADGLVQFPTDLPDVNLCTPVPGQVLPGFCSLTGARLAEFESAFTGESIVADNGIEFEQWLPSFNARFAVTENVIIRAAVSKGISRPDLSQFRVGGAIYDNTNVLRDAGTLESGPLFAIDTGNRQLRPVTAWNYDLSAEWYFDTVGSLTASVFMKDFSNLINEGAVEDTFVTDSGTSAVVEVRGPANEADAKLKGFELAYQQTFDMLPAPFNGLGMQATYTYVDGSDFENSTLGSRQSAFAQGLPFAGISDDTVNVAVFYENAKFAARMAYNWRSEFLLTPRDDIFPFSPIIGEASGQLDASVFYTVMDGVKVGIQAVNLLDTVTKTSQIIDFDGTQIPRTAFRNDRRFTFLMRFDF